MNGNGDGGTWNGDDGGGDDGQSHDGDDEHGDCDELDGHQLFVPLRPFFPFCNLSISNWQNVNK